MNDPTRLGKYTVKELIGEGSMARVYRARDANLERDVAIKTLKEHLLLDDDNAEEILRRFAREARIVARLQHENFVAIYDYDDAWDPPFIAMELIEGKTLAQWLREDRVFLPEEAVHIVRQLLWALGYAHGKGVVHRDVKAQNIFLLPGGRIKITDFGIAQIQSSTLTQSGSVMGTAAYMSPEQFCGEIVDHRSDLWSVGVLLFELLSGKRPFRGGADTVRHRILNDAPVFETSEPQRRIPDALEPVIERALAKSPSDRYQSAEEFCSALSEAVQEHESAATTPLKRAPAKPRRTHRKTDAPKRAQLGRRFLAIAASVVVLLSVATLGYRFVPTKPSHAWIAARLHETPCAVLDYATLDKTFVLRGIAGDRGQVDALLRDLAHRTKAQSKNEVTITDAKQCPVLDLVRSLKAQGRLTPSPFAMNTKHRVMHHGAPLDVHVAAPSYHAYVGLDYFDATGRVTHLLPDRELGSVQLASDEKKSLRDFAADTIGYEVNCPCGNELIVGIASASPEIFQGREEAESAAYYVSALQRAIDALPKSAQLSMFVLPITTVER